MYNTIQLNHKNFQLSLEKEKQKKGQTHLRPSFLRYCPMSLTMSWLAWFRETVGSLLTSSWPFSAAPLSLDVAPFCTQPLLAACIASLQMPLFRRDFLRGGSPPSFPADSLVEARLIFKLRFVPLFFRLLFAPWIIDNRDLL